MRGISPALFAFAMVTLAGIAYFVYLVACWNQYQTTRAGMLARIDEVLDRLPRPEAAGAGE